MKKTFGTFMLTAALLVGGGTGLASASETQDVQSDTQVEPKCEGSNFGQMKQHIEEMHPDLTNKEVVEHYKNMHGTGGSSKSKNFQMM
ncbi:MAG: hypothetical protein ACQEXB_07235 [Bacillota bacterium]